MVSFHFIMVVTFGVSTVIRVHIMHLSCNSLINTLIKWFYNGLFGSSHAIL